MIDQHINRIRIMNIGEEFAALSLYVVDKFRAPNDIWISRAGGREIFQQVTKNGLISVFRVFHRDYDLTPESQITFIMIEILEGEKALGAMQSLDLLINDMLARNLDKEGILGEFLENVH